MFSVFIRRLERPILVTQTGFPEVGTASGSVALVTWQQLCNSVETHLGDHIRDILAEHSGLHHHSDSAPLGLGLSSTVPTPLSISVSADS